MTIEDFSNTFDIFYNNLMSDRAPEVNDYEKSMLLTLAQEDIVKELYNKAFEGSEQSRRALDALLIRELLDPVKDNSDEKIYGAKMRRTVFDLPEKLWYILRETVRVAEDGSCLYGNYIMVRPERLDDLTYDLGNPFRGPSSGHLAIRLDIGGDRNTRSVEIITRDKIDKYSLTYLRRPRPILLADFSDESVYDQIHIRGVDTFKKDVDSYDQTDLKSEPCELSETIQMDIVTKAVMFAKAAFAS